MSKPTMKQSALSLALVTLGLASTALTACARTPPPEPASGAADAAVTAAPATDGTATPAPASPALPPVHVHKSATCGCCSLWVDHMRDAGFTVETTDVDDVNAIKERVGVPLGKGSCHTAEVGGYFVEGHVPAEDVKRLLAERPDAKGLVVPGMPAGSPGMEMPDGRTQPYTVELVHDDGATSAFARHQEAADEPAAVDHAGH